MLGRVLTGMSQSQPTNNSMPESHSLILPEMLRREHIPSGSSAYLRVHGTRVSYGDIPRLHLRGLEPAIEDFRSIAKQGNEWHSVHQVEIHFVRPKCRHKTLNLILKLCPPSDPPKIAGMSQHSPIAVWAQYYCSSALRAGRPFTMPELLAMTTVDGELCLNSQVLSGDNEWNDHRYHGVVYYGRDMRMDEFTWLPYLEPNVFSVLQDMALHVNASPAANHLGRIVDAFWNEPDYLANILQQFINRFGYAHAKTLLGEKQLKAVRDLRLRAELDPQTKITNGQALFSISETQPSIGQLEFPHLKLESLK